MTTREDPADRLAAIAVELAIKVRDDDPEANGRWLAAALPDPADWFRLAFVLAAGEPHQLAWMLREVILQLADQHRDNAEMDRLATAAMRAVYR